MFRLDEKLARIRAGGYRRSDERDPDSAVHCAQRYAMNRIPERGIPRDMAISRRRSLLSLITGIRDCLQLR